MKIKEKLKKYWWVVVIFLCIYGYGLYVNWSYESKIGSYMENAYEVNTPEKMLEQLQLAKLGMINEGLTEGMYGAIIFKKPDNKMEFQYKHLDSIIERVNAVDHWYKETYGNTTMQTETLGDVYEQKMDNLREFIFEDVRSDWIARNTWYINNHIVMYFVKLCNASVRGGVTGGFLGFSNTSLIMLMILMLYYFYSRKDRTKDEDDNEGLFEGWFGNKKKKKEEEGLRKLKEIKEKKIPEEPKEVDKK